MLKNLFGRVRDKFFPSKTKAETPVPARTFSQPRDLSTYVYLNPGLNRKERRRLAKMIASGRMRKASNLFERMLTPAMRAEAHKAEIEAAKWQLKNSPVNVPASSARINDNSMRRRRDEPTLIFTKPSIADKMQKPVSV